MNTDFDFELFRWLRRGCRRKRILRYLAVQKRTVTPSQIGRSLSLKLGNISESLSQLRRLNLVALLNPEKPFNRLYRITDLGRRIVAKLE